MASSYRNSPVCVLLILLSCCAGCCFGFGTFGFDFHHRYSDPVKGILAVDDLPKKGSFAYYSALAHRDRYFRLRGRGLAAQGNDKTPLTFSAGNDTYRLNSLGLYVISSLASAYPLIYIYIYFYFLSYLNCTNCNFGLLVENRRGDQSFQYILCLFADNLFFFLTIFSETGGRLT